MFMDEKSLAFSIRPKRRPSASCSIMRAGRFKDCRGPLGGDTRNPTPGTS